MNLSQNFDMSLGRVTRGRLMRAMATLICAVLALTGCDGDFVDFPTRPQDPIDRPYRVEAVSFSGGSGVTLAGELTMPNTDGPHKAVVLISGSGPQDRNEALAGHRPFLVLSDYLTRNGFAVLRYDDRGVGQSTGSYETAALPDFADDAAGAFRFLEGRSEVDGNAVGFLGHSEGGYIAPLAARQVDPAFMVFMAGGARPLLDIVYQQTEDMLRAQGSSEAEIEQTLLQYRAVGAILAKPAPLADIRQEIDAYLMADGVDADTRQAVLDQFANPWGVHHAGYDPIVALREYDGPVLAMFGEKDLQVSARVEAPIMRDALQNPWSEVRVLEGLNHLFQPAQTGLPTEYEQIEITMSERAMSQVSNWIDGQ